ncbi:MAG: TA system antitoxin ParD family protein [Pseudomonadales bacterium]
MAASAPLRLDQDLIDAAALEAKRMKRSAPKQIEYWAELGKAIDDVLDPDDVIAIKEGLAHLKIVPPTSLVVDSKAVFDDLEVARENKSLPGLAASASVIYQPSKEHPGLLEQINADGERVAGRFRNGEFEPLPT